MNVIIYKGFSPPTQFVHFKINYEKLKMSELIIMYVKEEQRIKAEKSDFVHVVIDGQKSKENKDNSKDKNKSYRVFSVNKTITPGTKHTPKYHHCKKHGHVRKNCNKFKD
jgi:hypothetical protein